MPDFAKMTTDKLEEWRTAQRGKIDAARAELKSSDEEWRARVQEERQAALIRAMKLPEGTRIIVPTAKIAAEGHGDD